MLTFWSPPVPLRTNKFNIKKFCILITLHLYFVWISEQIVTFAYTSLTNWILWRERKPTRCNNHMFIINFCLNMFRASLCPSSGEQRPCVTACGVLRWFCWMWLVAVVGRCVIGCEYCQRSTPYAVTHGLCSPEDGHNDARNMLRQKLIIKKLIVASCWFSLSSHFVYWSYVKFPFFLSDFNGTWNFPTDFRKIFKYKFSWKSFQWVPSCSWRKDRHEEVNSSFS